MLHIGVQSRGIIHEDAKELGYRRIQKSGLSSIDYNIIWSDITEVYDDFSAYHEHKRLANQYGLRFSQVHGPRYRPLEIIENFDLAIVHMERSMQICEILESPFLVVHPLQLRYFVGEEMETKYNKNYFMRLGEIAKKYNVVICPENLFIRYGFRITEGYCCRATDMVELIETINKDVGQEVLGTCFDVGHSNALRQNIKREIKTLGKHLKCLHVHDNDGNGDNHQVPYVFGDTTTGEPCTDWSGFLTGLREIGFHGTISFEPFKWLINTPATIQQHMLQYLNEIGKQFAYVIGFEEVLKQQKEAGKEIIIFGAGKMLDVYMETFGEKYPPTFVVDNNADLWGTKKYEIPLENPEKIKDVPKEKRCVILNSRYYELIEAQLEEMDIKEYIYSEEICRMNGKPL